MTNSNEQQQLIAFSHHSSKEELHEHWYQHWIYAAHSSQLENNGDYLTLQIGHYPVIILRNNEGQIVALNNSCRHRGSRICQQDKGNAPNLVCPYHQWTYDLNGKLQFARNMMEEIDLEALPLTTFAVNEQQGFIFICLSGSATSQPPLSESFSSLPLADPGQWISAGEYRQVQDAAWQSAELFSHDNARCLLKQNNVNLWQTDSHLALIRILPLNLYQTEVAIQCLVNSQAVAGRDFLDQALLEEWGISHYVPVSDAAPEDHQATQEFAEKYGLEAPRLRHDEMDYNDMFAAHKQWDSSVQELVCTMVVDETHNVKSYTFKADNGSWFKFRPGQFITLSLPTADGPVLRTYTISSTPSRPFSISVTVKLQAESTGTRWLFDNVRPGTSLKAYGPAGEFSFFNQPASKYLFISAGSGITPMLSMSRWMFDYGNDMDVNFISCVQTPADILFREELENIARRCPNFRLSWVCDEDQSNTWTGYRGRFNRLLLGLTAPDYMERDVYCCGPAPFMKAVREALDASGFDMNRYFEESFGAPEPASQQDQFPSGDELVEVSFSQSDKQRQCSQRETLLEACKAADIAIPSACGFGVCGTCKVKVLSGETHMVHSGGISEDDIRAGYVLACCTHPLSNTAIEL